MRSWHLLEMVSTLLVGQVLLEDSLRKEKVIIQLKVLWFLLGKWAIVQKRLQVSSTQLFIKNLAVMWDLVSIIIGGVNRHIGQVSVNVNVNTLAKYRSNRSNWSISLIGLTEYRSNQSHLRILFLHFPLKTGLPFYMVIWAMRRSSCLQGDGRTFVSQLF